MEHAGPGPSKHPATRTAVVVAVAVAMVGTVWWLWHRAQASVGRPATVPPAASPGTRAATSSTLSTSSTIVVVIGPWAPGQCLVWDQAAGQDPQRESRSVACDQTHLIEITGAVDLSTRFPSFPTGADFEAVRAADCTDFARRFLGALVDPLGRFSVEQLIPTVEDWNGAGAGARTLWCGMGGARHVVTSAEARRVLTPFSGEVRGASQKFLYGQGTCIMTAPSGEIDAIVACAGPHDLEVTGSVDVAGRASTNPTRADSQGDLLARLCVPLSRSHLGRPLRADEGSAFIPISPEGWAVGERIVECTVARYQGNARARVTGPLATAA